MIPPNSHLAITWIIEKGFIPVVSHPERQVDADHTIESVLQWREIGARLQVNLGSLAGAHGPMVMRTGWDLLERGAADYLASDFHGRGQHFASKIREEMERRHAVAQFQMLTSANPVRLLSGELPLAVPSVPRIKRTWRDRLFGS
jgi:tyrosine-protein phosphatase YwqE